MYIEKEKYKTAFRHELGNCLLLGDSNFTYIPIPKNASTYLNYIFKNKLNYITTTNYKKLENKKYIVCLRDPYERWLSGIVEYFTRYFLNDIAFTDSVYDIIFKKIIFDEHTEPQVNFLQELDTDNIIFFNISNLDNTLYYFLNNSLNVNDKIIGEIKSDWSSNRNSSKHNIRKRELMKLFQKQLNSNNNFYQKIKEVYTKDYNLINSINFYSNLK